MLKIAQAELRLEADFAGALEREEFFLLYQPIVSLASNRSWASRRWSDGSIRCWA